MEKTFNRKVVKRIKEFAANNLPAEKYNKMTAEEPSEPSLKHWLSQMNEEETSLLFCHLDVAL